MATAMAILAAAQTSCGSSFGAGTGECRITADNPHESDTSPGQIVGKGRIVCDVQADNVFLSVKVEQDIGGRWVDFAVGNDPAIGTIKVGKRTTRQATDACAAGRFRTAARGKGTLGEEPSGSAAWTYSQAVTDPCGN